MNTDKAKKIIVSGRGRIVPIIEYYGTTGDIMELLNCELDQDSYHTVIYIVSELPTHKKTPEVIDKIREFVSRGLGNAESEKIAREIVVEYDMLKESRK